MPIQLLTNEDIFKSGAKIQVVGVGGGGGNILNSMVEKGIDGIEFVAINTDHQALELNKAQKKIQIGKTLTNGLGTGMNSELGAKAAEESRQDIENALQGSDMIFLTAGMGGGTGTGATPVIAEIAKRLGALVVAIVTKPFEFEGNPRMKLALEGVNKLRNEVDSMIVIPNQKILSLVSPETGKTEALEYANRVLYNATKGISQIITRPGEVNTDFADVKTIMKDMGAAMIGMGVASGENRAEKAVQLAVTNPVLDDINIAGSKNILVNIISDGNIKMKEIECINKYIQDIVGMDARFILGWADDKSIKDEILVTVIATGFNNDVPSQKIDDNTDSKEAEEFPLEVPGQKHPSRIEIKLKPSELISPERRNVISMPQTEKELDDLSNIPAYKRRELEEKKRSMIIDDLDEVHVEKKKSSQDENLTFQDFPLSDEVSSPSFMRKQMQ
jgi:cell division protein FtsZ